MPKKKDWKTDPMSVNELKEIFNNTTMIQAERDLLKEKIKKEEKANELFAERFLQSNIAKLARIQLMREGKATRFRRGEFDDYHVGFGELLIKADQIVVKAETKKIKLNSGLY